MAELKKVKRCDKCGHLIPENASVCPYCSGNNFSARNNESAQFSDDGESTSDGDGTKKGLLYIAIAIVVVGLIFAISNILSNYYNKKNNLEEISALLDSQEQSQEVQYQDAEQMVEAVEEEPAVSTYEVDDFDIEFTGAINGKYKISGAIHTEGNDVYGRYYYHSTMRRQGDCDDTYITLAGTVDGNGYIYLTGYFTDGQTETLEGYMIKDSDGMLELNGTLYGHNGDTFSWSVRQTN